MTTRLSTVELTERDYALLRGLFEARVMTLSHLATIYFEGRIEAATKRLQKLKRAGVVSERPRRVYEPSVLTLTPTAFRLLHDHGVLADYPNIGWSNIEKRAHVSDLTLRHELAVMDVRAAIFSAVAANPRYRIIEFSTWPLLFQFRAAPAPNLREIMVQPDAFLYLSERNGDGFESEHVFFLEVDRGTEVQQTLATKAACYGDYYRRGGLAVRFGRPRDEYKRFPFRGLFACPNAERRNNAAERMLRNAPPVLTQAWLTTIPELTSDPLGAIWMQPVDYRHIVDGTPFDISCPVQIDGYRRRPEREALIERQLRKRALLAKPRPR